MPSFRKSSLAIILLTAALFMPLVAQQPVPLDALMRGGRIHYEGQRYERAKEQFTKVIELQPKNYDAYIGLGAALRGLKDLDGAEAQYKKAKDLDPRRGEAFYNLGVLYKDFRASKQDDLKASLGTYNTAKDYFRQFQDKTGDEADKAEAKEQVTVIDKTTAQIQNFLKAQAAMPPQPPPQPTPAPAPAPAPAPGAAPAPKK